MEALEKCTYSSDGSWQTVPQDALAGVVNFENINRNDVGSLRLVCSSWRSAVDSTLTKLEPNNCAISQLERTLQRFTLLKYLDIRRFDASLDDPRWLLNQSNQAFQPCVNALAAMPSLASLTISSEYAREMGRKVFARWASAQCFQEVMVPHELSNLDSHSVSRYQHFICLPSWLGRLSGVKELRVHPRDTDLCFNTDQHVRLTLLAFHPSSLAHLKVLRLDGTTLGAVPDSLASLPQLEVLSMSNSAISSVPVSMAHLTSLQRLDLSRNNLIKAPQALATLKQLAVLDLSHNTIHSASSALSQLTGLVELSLAHNQLSKVPQFIRELGQLTYLNISHNCLYGQLFTPELCGLGNLKALNGANVSEKVYPLQVLPDAAHLTALASLDLSCNYVASPKSLDFLPSIPTGELILPDHV